MSVTQKLSKKGRFSKASLVIKAVFSLSLIGGLIWSVNINELVNTLESSEKTYMLFIYLTLIPATMVCAFKWMLLLRAQGIRKPNFWRLYRLYYVGIFFSTFLPTEVGGDIVRSYEVGKTTGKQVESLAAVIMERITGFSIVILYAVVGLFLNWSLAYELELVYVVFGSSIVVGITIGLCANRRFAKWVKEKINFGPFQKGVEKLHFLYETFYLYKTNIKVLFQAMILSLIFQLYCIWYIFALMKCLYINQSFLLLVFIVPVITLISMIPITINSIGLREGAFVFFFTYVGVTGSQSLGLALLFRFATIFTAIIGGGLYIIDSFNKRRSVK